MKEKEIKDIIRKISHTNTSDIFFTAEVKDVKQTSCTVIEKNTLIHEDVWLVAAGNAENALIIYPKVKSKVLIADLSEGKRALLAILQYSQIEKIELLGDQYGGILIAEKVVDWMNNVFNDLQTLKNLLQATPIAGNGAPANILFTPQTKMVQLDNVINKKLKHG
ncbi:hypothetical protein [Thermaurantimonas aggregans]|uniref:hypothetical protein n=1 Tax=Thermaurantimonas aggregans TaxID=2173829 RepID=UPI0023F1D70B|nr:hypothetical protein [Thermaurantimonas aggregans]MCX8149210.1 hypothetical protein [Thermaurantimonas aggregans]